MRALIVNADDLGISPGVNEGVLQAFRQGIVRSASLMANMPFAAAAARLAVEAGLDLGLHLTLTAGQPVSPPGEVASLVDERGRFLPLGRLLARLTAGRVRQAELAREALAQVECARRYGARLSHLDGHHHIQAHPVVAPVVLELARALGLAVRCPVEPPRARRPRDLARAAVLLAPAWWLRHRARRCGVRTTAHFRGIALGYGFDAAALAAVIRDLPEGLTELMCHPGYPDAALAAATVFSSGRQREVEALTSPSVRYLLEERDIRLISWSEAWAGERQLLA